MYMYIYIYINISIYMIICFLLAFRFFYLISSVVLQYHGVVMFTMYMFVMAQWKFKAGNVVFRLLGNSRYK